MNEIPSPLYHVRIQQKIFHQKRALTQPCWHSNLGLSVSRTVRNKFVLFISHSVCCIYYSSPNRLTQQSLKLKRGVLWAGLEEMSEKFWTRSPQMTTTL